MAYVTTHLTMLSTRTPPRAPLRIVYDCSFKSNQHPSLNDCLQPGPPLLNDLTGILLRFRLHQYGITADIEKAFLHVNLDQEDRDATRFYWLSDANDPENEFKVCYVWCHKLSLHPKCHTQQASHAVYESSQHGHVKESVRG